MDWYKKQTLLIEYIFNEIDFFKEIEKKEKNIIIFDYIKNTVYSIQNNLVFLSEIKEKKCLSDNTEHFLNYPFRSIYENIFRLIYLLNLDEENKIKSIESEYVKIYKNVYDFLKTTKEKEKYQKKWEKIYKKNNFKTKKFLELNNLKKIKRENFRVIIEKDIEFFKKEFSDKISMDNTEQFYEEFKRNSEFLHNPLLNSNLLFKNNSFNNNDEKIFKIYCLLILFLNKKYKIIKEEELLKKIYDIENKK